MSNSVPFIYHELLEAFQQPDCPVCRLVHRSTVKHLDNLFYENVNDPGLREQLRKSLGFCKQHAYLALDPGKGDALGIAIIYHDVFNTLLKKISRMPGANQSNGISSLFGQHSGRLSENVKEAVQALTPQGPCPVCVQEDTATNLYLSELINALPREDFSEDFAGSSGLCIPHLRRAFEHARDGESYTKLLVIHHRKFETLDHELAELIRKSDYRFHDEELGTERDAGRRAIRLAVGEDHRVT